MTDETRTSFEDTLKEALEELNQMDNDDPKKREQKIKELKEINTIINETDSVNQDWYDRQEKRRIDEEKNKSTAETESKKIKQGYIKTAVEGAIAIGLAIVEIVVHRHDLRDIAQFEETGRFNSSAFRFWQNRKPRIKK